MKKFYYSLFAAASMMLAVTSCSQEEDFAPSSGEMTTFSVSLNGVTGSRATGDGTTATKLYYQAYRGDELVINEDVNIETTTKIDMSLLKGETYDIIFWAQAPDATFYQIDDLRSISIDYGTAALKANQESYDAFYNALNDFTSDAKTHTIELRRPFAKLNLGTSDWNIVETDAATNPNETDPVTHTSVTVKGLANTLNTLTGVATGDEDVTFALSEIPTDFFTLNNVSYKRLSLNYLLVPNSKAPQGLDEYQAEGEDGKANVDLAFALNRGDKQLFTIEVPNAPVQRNWRTNVVGDLLTGSKFDVIIKPDTDDNYNTLEILEEVLTNGGEVTLFSNATLPENITIPEDVTVKINLNEKTLKVNSSDNIVKGNLVISNGNLNVEIPSQGGARETAFEAVNGGIININDVKMTVAPQNAAVTVDYSDTNSNRQAEVYININNTTMTVENGGYGIWVPFGAKYVEMNVNNSSITGNNAVLLSNVTESVIVIDEKSTINKLHVDGGHATIKYAGEKPTVAGEQYVTYVKMGTTTYEGIYQVENKKEYNVTSAEGVLNLHKLMADISTGEGQGATINLTTDIDLKNEPFTPIDKMWVTFNGNGHTIKNLNVTGENDWAGRSGFFTYLGGSTISNLTLENVTSTGRQAGIFAGQQEGGKIENCIIAGNNTVVWSATTGIDNVTGNGIGAFVGVSVSYGSANEISGTIAEGATVSLQPGAMTPMWSKNNKYYGGLMESTSLTIIEPVVNVTDNGSVGYIQSVSNDTELKAAIGTLKTTGGTIVLAAGTYSQNINLTVAEFGNDAKGDLVFKAAEGAEVIISGTVTLGYYERGKTPAQWKGDVTFEGITFDHAVSSTNSFSVQNVGKSTTSNALTLKNCKIIGDGEYGIIGVSGGLAYNSRIIGCTFINAALQPHGNFGTGLLVDGCTFTESRINVQAGNSVTVQNCIFTNTLTNANVDESFYVIRSNDNPVTVSGCTIKVNSELADVKENQLQWGILWNRGATKQWTIKDVTLTMSDAAMKQTELMITKPMDKAGNYTSNPAPYTFTNFTVNGKNYIAEGVLESEGVYFISSVDGLNYSNEKLFSNGGTYKLTQSVDMTGVEWTSKVPLTKHFTFDGGGNTISNWKTTSGALLVPQSNYNIEIKNLKLTKCTVNTTSNYAALLIGYADSNKKVEISGIEVTQSEVTGNDYCAALLGWSSMNANISGCSVKNSKFIGGGSTGAYAGHVVAGDKGVVTISDAVVEGCEITTNDSNKNKAGIVLGTANVGTTSITTSSLTGNKVNGVENNTTIYGRTVLGSTGKLTVNGEDKQ